MNLPPTISQLSSLIRQSQTTPTQLVAACLERIERLDKNVHAWVIVDAAGATRAAEELTREARSGRFRGALHGIPLGIKDLCDIRGMPTRAGSTLTSAAPAEQDATVVARLRSAGAVILGKTVTTEFACFDPSPTRNPWNLAHTPGGSSSGSAAAVALDMCAGAIASQTGGSITRPASYCGVAGCKPTFGRVSRAGVVPVSFHLDHVGVIARTAADCAILLQVIAGEDPRDPACAPHGSFAIETGHALERPPQLGVLREFFFTEADQWSVEQIEQALVRLREAGATIVDAPLPEGFDQVHVMHRRLMAAEAADFHSREYGAPREGYGPNLSALLDEGFCVTMSEYQEALRHQELFRNALTRNLAGIDALVTPATPTAAPASLATTGDPRFNSPFSHAGVPTVSIPCALTAEKMPVSLQLIGPHWGEAKLLTTAIWCEQKLLFGAVPSLA